MADEFDRYMDKLNTMNKESAKAQMDFQERLSSTAHQREVKDLLAAGLNPVLSANNGASSPMGAYANVDNSAVSAKFARQNLDRELANQRTIAMMNNENAMKIAQAQIASNYALGIYQSDNAKEASIYNTDMMQTLKQMEIDNPSSLVGTVNKLVSNYMGNNSIAETAKNVGEHGLFHTIYDLAKRAYDRDHGFNYSARRVADIERRINQERSIIAGAKRARTSAINSGASKAQAQQIYYNYLQDNNYYKLVGKNIFKTII